MRTMQILLTFLLLIGSFNVFSQTEQGSSTISPKVSAYIENKIEDENVRCQAICSTHQMTCNRGASPAERDQCYSQYKECLKGCGHDLEF